MSTTGIRKRKLKDGSTVYDVKYELPRDPGNPGKRRTRWKTVRGTKKAAEAERRRLLGQIDTGSHVDPTKQTVGEWLEEWLRDWVEAQHGEHRTLERYRELVRLHIDPELGSIRLQQLQGRDLRRLYNDLQSLDRKPRPLAPRTVLHVHRLLAKALRDATRDRRVSRSVTEDVDAPNPKKARSAEGVEGKPPATMHALEIEDMHKLLTAFRECRSSNISFTLVALGFATGLRRGELLALRWSDIDLEAATLRVLRSVERMAGRIGLKGPKTESSRRTIGLDDATVQLFRGEWRHQAESALKLGVRLPGDALVFAAGPDQPHTLRSPDRVSHSFRWFANKAGFHGFRFQDMRHTHATQLLLGGVPVHAVSQRLGHSSPVTTMSVYSHVLKRAEDQAVSVTGGLLRHALTAET